MKIIDINGETMVCAQIAKSGNLEQLKIARQNNHPWDRLTCAYAALNGHLEIIK